MKFWKPLILQLGKKCTHLVTYWCVLSKLLIKPFCWWHYINSPNCLTIDHYFLVLPSLLTPCQTQGYQGYKARGTGKLQVTL